MQEKIYLDTQEVLTSAISALSRDDIVGLDELSQHTIHNASVFQDDCSIDVAVILYSLSKILKFYPKHTKKFQRMLVQSKQFLDSRSLQKFESTLHQIFNQISKIDKESHRCVMHVIEQAKVKKGSFLYRHGLSLEQSADAVGVSQWELYNYVGKTKINDDGSDSVANMKKRLAYARSIFKRQDTVLVFDAGPIITMALNGILWLLPSLKNKSHSTFLIPPAVKQELITTPLQTKKHKLEAFRVMEHITDGSLKIIQNDQIFLKARQLQELCNTTFYAFGNPIKIVHDGEMEAVALLLLSGHETLVVDERTMRYLIETPSRVVKRFKNRLHTKIHVDEKQLALIKKEFANLRCIRSVEFLTVAFEMGLFKELIDKSLHVSHKSKQFLEALLWGLKLNGSGVSDREIEFLVKNVK